MAALLPVLYNSAWWATQSAVMYIPRAAVTRFVLVTFGGFWMQSGVRLAEAITATPASDIPVAIVRSILFSTVNQVTSLILTTLGKLAYNTTYIALKGTAKGVVVLVKLTGQSSLALAHALTTLPTLKNKNTQLQLTDIGASTLDNNDNNNSNNNCNHNNDLTKDWVVMDADEKDSESSDAAHRTEDVSLSQEDVKLLLSSVDLTDAEILLYENSPVQPAQQQQQQQQQQSQQQEGQQEVPLVATKGTVKDIAAIFQVD